MSWIRSQARRAIFLFITLGFLLCGSAIAQDQMQQQFLKAQRDNAQAMRMYVWKSRTEIRKNGESKNTQLYLMRYDLNGTLQKTPIGVSAKPDVPTRGLRGKVAQKKVKELQETVEELSNLVKSYSHLPPAKMQDFLVGRTVGGSRDIQVQGKNVLRTGDALTIWIDADTHKQKRMEITTSMDSKPVHASSDFRNLPEGLNYAARTVVDYPAEQLQLISENFDYQRQNP
jgi:hypothetical protein